MEKNEELEATIEAKINALPKHVRQKAEIVAHKISDRCDEIEASVKNGETLTPDHVREIVGMLHQMPIPDDLKRDGLRAIQEDMVKAVMVGQIADQDAAECLLIVQEAILDLVVEA